MDVVNYDYAKTCDHVEETKVVSENMKIIPYTQYYLKLIITKYFNCRAYYVRSPRTYEWHDQILCFSNKNEQNIQAM